MKNELINKVFKQLKTMKQLGLKIILDENDSFTYKIDVEDEMFYYSLSFEDIKDVSITTFFDKKYQDTCMISLDDETLDECGIGELEIMTDLFKSVIDRRQNGTI